MILYRATRHRLFSLVIGTTVLFGCVAAACGQEPGRAAGLSSRRLPLPPAMKMPARDCLRCDGPTVAAPCFDSHHGFQYYGTYPWDDDPYNGARDCPGGECGYLGAMLSLRWIEKHQRAGRGDLRHHRTGHDPLTDHCLQCGPAPTGAEASAPPAARRSEGVNR